MVERQPSKLDVAGSSPVTRSLRGVRCIRVHVRFGTEGIVLETGMWHYGGMAKKQTCTACGVPKRLSEFAYRDKAKGVRLRRCRSCQSELSKSHYRAHKVEYNARRCQHTREYRIRDRELVLDYLRLHSCVDCGEDDPVVLQFDHVRGRKLRTICEMVDDGAAVEKLLAEIAKCDVRCANCHLRRTAQERNYFKNGQRA